MKKLLFFYLLVTFASKCYSQVSYLDTISFEGGKHNILMDTSAGNLWQIGKPGKVFLNAAHSLPKAIITDTVNNYPSNNRSSFKFFVRFNGVNELSFWNKYDTDSGHAGGYIEDSIPGYPWTNIVLDTVLKQNFGFHSFTRSFYDTTQIITENIPAFSGKSNWVYSRFDWRFFCLKPASDFNLDTVWLRFTFRSDSVAIPKEGWLVDNIVFKASYCVDVQERNLSKTISTYPNPFSNSFQIDIGKEVKNARISIFNILGEKIYFDTFFDYEILINPEIKKGFYYLQINADNETWTGKIIKN